LWFAGGGWFGRCPGNSNQGHTFNGSGDYRLETTVSRDGPGGQEDWRWCYRCACLWFSLSGERSCVFEGYHSGLNSGNYVLRFG
jgi:hypothetical protein